MFAKNVWKEYVVGVAGDWRNLRPTSAFSSFFPLVFFAISVSVTVL